MYTSFIVAFSVFLLSAVGDFPLVINGLINGTRGFDVFTTQANLKPYASIDVTSNATLLLCLHEFTIPLNSSQWSPTGCSVYVEIDKNYTAPNSLYIPLRNLQYQVALFVKDPTQYAEVTFNLYGETCTPVQTYDDYEDDCTTSTPLNPGPNQVQVEDTPAFFSFTPPDGGVLGSISFLEEDESSEASTVNFYIRRNGSPSEANRDYYGISPLIITYPQYGTYFIRVNTSSPGVKNLTIVLVTCPTGKGGPNCNINITQTSNTQMALQLLTTGYTYFQVNATSNFSYTLWASVRSTNGTTPTIPNIFASLGQLPNPDGSADISGCNQGSCGSVNAIQFNNSVAKTNQIWFVAVSGTNGTEYGLWINSLCAPNCDDHGECTASGVCECVADFIGVDCGKTNGLGAQYIVLIIIASLVVASAVIGFIAWAYMRRKRVDYEHVS